MSVVTNLEILKQKSIPDKHPNSQNRIIAKLETELKKHDTGIGLSAIQLGITNCVAIIRIPRKDGSIFKLNLVNTEIIDKYDKVIYEEGCLSLPNVNVRTERYNYIHIRNCGKEYILNGLEAVAVQHEIDHFNGILITDRKMKPTMRESRKIGRNEPCPCGSGKKYKRCCGR